MLTHIAHRLLCARHLRTREQAEHDVVVTYGLLWIYCIAGIGDRVSDRCVARVRALLAVRPAGSQIDDRGTEYERSTEKRTVLQDSSAGDLSIFS